MIEDFGVSFPSLALAEPSTSGDRVWCNWRNDTDWMNWRGFFVPRSLCELYLEFGEICLASGF